MQSTCLNCKDRKLHCHSTCTEYLEFRQAKDEENKWLQTTECEKHEIENAKRVKDYLRKKRKFRF